MQKLTKKNVKLRPTIWLSIDSFGTLGRVLVGLKVLGMEEAAPIWEPAVQSIRCA